MRIAFVAACGFCLFVNTAQAQSLDPLDHAVRSLPTKTERQVADIVSWVTVSGAITLDLTTAIGPCREADDCQRTLLLAGARYGTVWGVTTLIKKLAHRERPCAAYSLGCGHSDAYVSFPSGHTAFAFTGVSFQDSKRRPRLAFSVPLAVSTGGLRVAAGKHWLTDTLAGAGIGMGASLIR